MALGMARVLARAWHPRPFERDDWPRSAGDMRVGAGRRGGEMAGHVVYAFYAICEEFLAGKVLARARRVHLSRPGMESAAELGSCARARPSRNMAVKAVALLVAVGVTAFSADAARAEGVINPNPATPAISAAPPAPPPPAPSAEAVETVAEAVETVAEAVETVAEAVETVASVAPAAAAPATQAAPAIAQPAAPVTKAVAPVAESAARVTRAVARTAAPARRAVEKVAASAAETNPQPVLRQAPAPAKVAHQTEQATTSAAPARAQRTPASAPDASSEGASPVAAPAVRGGDAVAEVATSEPRRSAQRSAPLQARTRPVPAHAAAAAGAPTSATITALLQEDAGSRPQPDRSLAALALPRHGGPFHDDGADGGSLMAAAAAAGLNLSFVAALVAALALAVPRPGRRLRLGMASRPPPPLLFALERPG